MKPISEPAGSEPGTEVQPYGAAVMRPIGLHHVEPIIEMLNQILADALTLRDLYKR